MVSATVLNEVPMADHERSSNQQEGQRTAKKPFEPPRLVVYGDIATLTRVVGKTGLADGGKGGTSRTRP